MKVAIVYTSTTGNTEAMANAINEQAVASGAEVVFGTPDSVDVGSVNTSDVIILGSPAMGDEVLEDGMEDFFAANESEFSGKKMALFGSYDWGDGQWLRDWEDRVNTVGGTVVTESLKVNLTPSDDDLAACKEWTKKVLS